MLVTSPGWGSPYGRLQRYERRQGGAWQAVGEPVAAILGKNGMGWGLGLHPRAVEPAAEPADEPADEPAAEPRKTEGDGRAVAGAFSLPFAFAYDPAQLAGASMPVLDIGPDTFCVDDSQSKQYNTVVERPADAPAAWNSAEAMLRGDGYYRIGIMVSHNADPPAPGSGSCIFIHINHDDGSPTVGCTTLDPERLKELILWLDPSQRPVFVQLPEPAYERLRNEWGLP